MKKNLIALFSIFFITLLSPIWGAVSHNTRTSIDPPRRPTLIDSVIYDPVSQKVRNEIYATSKRQSVYSYNIANSATPGFRPVHLPNDPSDMNTLGSNDTSGDFNLESEMAKMNDNRMRQMTLLKILSTRSAIRQKLITMGKGG